MLFCVAVVCFCLVVSAVLVFFLWRPQESPAGHSLVPEKKEPGPETDLSREGHPHGQGSWGGCAEVEGPEGRD